MLHRMISIMFFSVFFLHALLYTSIFSVVGASPLQRRQGCQLEPNNPDCQLPLWDDATYNITFDDLTANKSNPRNITTSSLVFSDFTIATTTSLNTSRSNAYNNSTTYLRLRANNTGVVSISPSAANLAHHALDYIKLEALAFGCTQPSRTGGASLPTNCTVILTGRCVGSDSSGTLDTKTYAWEAEYQVAKGMKVADMQWIDLDTYGKRYLCSNYTVRAVSETVGGRMPVVWIDQVKVVEYTRSAIFR